MNLRFVLTVPATWSDKAKDKTLSAAIKASIQPQDVSLISEPEAAALYALRAIQPNSVSVGCTAGLRMHYLTEFYRGTMYSLFAMREAAQW
jgi:hypothetical protein